ncbi:MAG: hypothetical protein ACKO0Z_01035 [Betaproteobacteria bacterium]
MTPEGKVKERVKKLLKRFNVYYHMPVQNGMGEPTLDFICCVSGRFLAIETKAPGNHMTPRQKLTANKMETAGGFVLEISTDDDLARLEGYLALIDSI